MDNQCVCLSRDVDVERIYERRPRPLCPPHLVASHYYSLLRFFFIQKLATTSGSLQLCPEIIYNILVVPEFTQCCFERVSRLVLADTTQLDKLFHVFATLLVKQTFVDRILLETSQVSDRYLGLHVHFLYAK